MAKDRREEWGGGFPKKPQTGFPRGSFRRKIEVKYLWRSRSKHRKEGEKKKRKYNACYVPLFLCFSP
jgi:hypothetical protein